MRTWTSVLELSKDCVFAYVSYVIQVVTEEENKKRKKDRARPSCV